MGDWLETYRGTVFRWEVDHNDHLTVAYYFSRIADAGAAMLGTIGLGPAAARTADCFVRYQRELRVGDILHIESGVISVDADAARLLTWRAADLIERGEPFGVAASKAKYFASEAAVCSANLAIQAFGGYGYVDEYPVQKYMRDARVMTLYEGTSQIQKLLIGRSETGISAFL